MADMYSIVRGKASERENGVGQWRAMEVDEIPEKKRRTCPIFGVEIDTLMIPPTEEWGYTVWQAEVERYEQYTSDR